MICKFLMVGMLATFCGSVATAQLIYSNAFNGPTVTLNGKAPTMASNLLGGSSTATWICTYTNAGMDGTIYQDGTLFTNGGCALLPFTPKSGCIYFLTASLTVPAAMPTWVALGFSHAAAQTNNDGYARFTDLPTGYAWMNPQSGHTFNLFGGAKTANGLTAVNSLPSAGTYTLQLELNTTGVEWSVSAYVNAVITGTNVVGGTSMGQYIYTNGNPAISYVGLGQTEFEGKSVAGIQWSNVALSVTQVPNLTNTYWAAPAAIGSGDGSSPTNAASYLNTTFWSGIQSALSTVSVNVNFLDGAYNAGTLSFTDMGDAVHQLSLQAVNLSGPVLSTTGSQVLDLTGSQNMKFYGMVINGPCSSWGIICQQDHLLPCRNLEFSYCQLINLTNAYYGAMGLLNGTRDVLVDNCTFTNNINGDHQHMIYGSHEVVGVIVTNCLFQDCLADYVRFRDDSEYCVVENCTFISTMSASAFPFITAELYNDVDPGPGNEFFGTYFQVSSNSFTYNVSGGPGPYAAVHFSDSGYSPQSYDCDLTSTQASQLGSGSASFQQAFLQTNFGILATNLKIFGNTYNSRVGYHLEYTYTYDDANAPYNGWAGTVNLNNAPDASGAPLAAIPAFRNGNFDRQGMLLLPANSANLENYQCLFRTWQCNPKYTDILSHPGFNGTSNAMRFDGTTSQYIYQWISNPGTNWTMDCFFAIGSRFTGTGTKFKVDVFHNDIAGSKMSVGVDNLGRFGIYNGGVFMILPELGTVVFSVDSNTNGNYTDPGDTLNVYRLRIVGNYSAATPYVSIYTSDANSLNLDHQSLGRTFWVNGAPTSGQSVPETVVFYNYTAPVVLDQIALGAGLGEQPPVITNTSFNNGQFIFGGTNGFAGDTYYVLSSIDPTLVLSNWTVVATNTFDATGSFSVTNTATVNTPQLFYRLQVQ